MVAEPDEGTTSVEADDLVYNDVGLWTEEKHRLVAYYSALFSKSMRDKWDERVYIELYAGAGYARVRDTGRLIAGSPINALCLDVPFDKYIFCERDPEKRSALQIRVKRHAPDADVTFIPSDCDSGVGEILTAIPQHSRTRRVLSLCFVDPNDIGIKFSTLQALSQRFVDFIVLLALYMDAQRAEQQYVGKPTKINDLLGDASWLERWATAKLQGTTFPRFLAEAFASSMGQLGYIPPPFYSMKKVFFYEKNFPLYALGLFSRHKLAYELWDDALKYTDDQLKMF